MKISTLMSTSVLALGLLLTGCGPKEVVKTGENKEKISLTVYTTIYPLEDFTKKIGGSYVEVKSIYPPNVDAHSFEPSTKDMVALANSDLFIYTGVGIEGFAEKATEALEKEDVQVLKAADGIELIESTDDHHHDDEEGHSDENEGEHTGSENHGGEEHNHSDVDPHVWLDPVLSITLANNIKNSLSKLMPEHAAEFETNFKQLKSELEKLDQEFKTTIESSKTKNLLVSHDAYGYWEKRYGIEAISISGLSPTQEPTQKELQAIIEESTEHNIHYVIFEQNVSTKVAKIIQEELGAKSLSLHNLEAITEENIKQKDDYFSIMRKNLETIKKVLND
ncbi:metal ABC transporter substrate-binding protein [Neobacillus niacini]|uniref:metal ABC transporter substrate-binding protein n=1 Tax=Neobacillus niacini TaxID=86668 RepID=UPI00052F9307|nr:metal ABC transporter substrate-binding protein [Neobacillus niacini]KGM45682.1 adhesin [Neobacillus niacini]MEC1523362.1 metal ABC transporter substrate-binding protein [Neobacillus niacini]